MALLIQRIANGLLPTMDADRAPARHDRPDRVVFGVRPGNTPSAKPPIRIFLGSERNQFRAERVFLWSVEKHRDPGRVYEIYLMKDLKGFKGRFWLTGFTNYRFAIPLFCGFRGRAIYNDTDQVYLRDPAELFDRDMNGAGFLSINDRDTSVMLIDCERMAGVWSRDAVYSDSRKRLEARARADKLWGPMDAIWNARDKEYVPGESACVHFTTLHTQPWRPFPGQFVYFGNPTGDLWPELEAEADRDAFMPVSAIRPSRDWPEAALELSSRPDGTELLGLLGPNPDLASRGFPPDPPSQAKGGTSSSPSPSEGESGGTRAEREPLTEILERLPDADIPWVLERLFSAYDRLIIKLREPLISRGSRVRRSRHFWLQQFERASILHPRTRWKLIRGRETVRGGPPPEGPVQVLTHGKPGHNHQALALARKLAGISGRPLEVTPLPASPALPVVRRLFRLKPPAALHKGAAVIVAAGWMPSRVARWLAEDTDTRIVVMGRKAGSPPEHGGVAVACRHFGLPAHPNRIDTLLPINAGQQERQQVNHRPWQSWLDADKRFAVLVGGSSRSHEFSDEEAGRLIEEVSEWAAREHAKLLVVTSRRSLSRINVLRGDLSADALLYEWHADDDRNPYGLALRHADALVVTGESESMLADAVNSGKPVYIRPLPQRESGRWRRFCDTVARKAVAPRYNRRGSIRPQQGSTYICARMLERQWILPYRNVEALHESLVDKGLARFFDPSDQSSPAGGAEAPDELTATAEVIAGRLGLRDDPSRAADIPSACAQEASGPVKAAR